MPHSHGFQVDFHLSLGESLPHPGLGFLPKSTQNLEVLLGKHPRMERVKSKSNFFSFLGVHHCPVGTGNVLGWKSLFPPGRNLKEWNFSCRTDGFVSFPTSPWECSGKSGKSQRAVLERFGRDGARKNGIHGRGKRGITLETRHRKLLERGI